MMDYLIPAILLLASAVSLRKKENSYALLLEGGAEGLKLLKDILPTLILLLTAVELFRASGAADLLQRLCAPLFSRLGIPAECAVLVLIRPITFYTISVYFGAAGIQRTRYTLPAALFADLVGFTAAAWTAKLFF